MSESKEAPKAPAKTQYELSTGAVALLHEIMPTPQWYKEDPKQAKTIVAAVAAIDALPDVMRPQPDKDEEKDHFEKRVDLWAAPFLQFEWSDKQKEAAKKCVAFYLKQGAFSVTEHTAALLHMLGLDDD